MAAEHNVFMAKHFMSVYDIATNGGQKPDLTFLLDIEVDKAIEHINKRGNKECHYTREFLHAVRCRYFEQSAHIPRIVRIDSNRAMDIVIKEVLEHPRLKQLLKRDS
jgi:thymidylate kinase